MSSPTTTSRRSPDDLADAPSAGPHTWTHNSARLFSLHQACYELRICQQPPRQATPGQATLEQRMQAIPQPTHPRGRAALPDHRGGDPAAEAPSSCAPTA